MTAPVVCLMGPTASGKTDIALELAERFPVLVVSVDSALVYRGMDIGTAKPDAATRARVPHRLIDIREPEEPYSAGAFVRDAERAIADGRAAGRLPLLVGGTMMYFRALTRGLAPLPGADPALRARIDALAAGEGWPAVHARLAAVDPQSAARIAPHDGQRIQRALEVWHASGRPMSVWQAGTAPAAGHRFLRLALVPADRGELHRRIEARFDVMAAQGFLDEVRRLRRRPGLTADSPSMRAVGYRQLWAHLDAACDWSEARARAVSATRQLAKRQLTWLRSESPSGCIDPLEAGAVDTILSIIGRSLDV